MSDWLIWLGIVGCLSQSAAFSGLNLGVFSLSRLRLEAAARSGDPAAVRVLALRRDANRTLVTILTGNVAINVLLTLLVDSVLAGVAAFLFATVLITALGEIVPQAYFARHAMRTAARLAPLLTVYRALLWPVAAPVGALLDRLVGPEGIPFYREAELRDILRHHAEAADTDVGRLEAIGAMNFLALDDVRAGREGERLDPASVITLPFAGGRPVFPRLSASPDDPFLQQVQASGRKWVVLVDEDGAPRRVLDSDAFVRGALFASATFDPLACCHRPLVVTDADEPLGRALGALTVQPESKGDDVIDRDVILVWTDSERRIVTGSDLLGYLLRGIARVRPVRG
jgi:hypothetical protein